MFRGCEAPEITRPFWSQHLVQEDASRHWKLNEKKLKKRECKGNRNDLIEKKIQNFIFVKI